MAKTWPYYGQNMVLTWSIKMVLSKTQPICSGMFPAKFQIAGNVLELPFIDVAKMALLWQKDGPHIVLRICSSSILINLLRDVLCQISHCWVYPVAPFLEMAKI